MGGGLRLRAHLPALPAHLRALPAARLVGEEGEAPAGLAPQLSSKHSLGPAR